MNIQEPLPLIPGEATVLSEKLSVVRKDGRVVFYHSYEPIYAFREGDKAGRRAAAAVLSDLELAGPKALGEALGINPSTVHRNREKYRAGGIDALNEPERVRTPYRLTPEKLMQAQELLDEGHSHRAVARVLNVVSGTIDYAVNKGRLRELARHRKTCEKKELVGPRERSDAATASPAGVAVSRHMERSLASSGWLDEAKPVFEPAEAVQYGGVLLALPALGELGLLEVAREVYGRLKNGFFGLQSVFLVLAFCALLRIKTIEQLSRKAPGELGRVLGLDRAPEVKTVRRKLEEMALRRRAREMAAKLAERWAQADPSALGFLYIDGHVRAYTGRKHSLPKTLVQRRRMCMPATTDTWVNDADSQPLFFVTAPANNGLLSMMEAKILPEVRRLVGEERRVTLIFDRGGWSPRTFMRWYEQGFDVLTYRKGAYEAWPGECFTEVEVNACGKTVEYRLGQRSDRLFEEKKDRKGNVTRKAFWMREVRRLCDNGHQTSVMTTRQDLEMPEIAMRMFSRWSQENFFRYMRHEYGLDHLPAYAVEPADPERPVPNPAVKKKRAELEKLRGQLAKAEKEYVKEALDNPEELQPTMRGFKIAQGEHGKRIRSLKARCEALEAEIKALPKKVPLKEVKEEEFIVKLEEERKVLVDCVKMAAYRAETSLLDVLKPFFHRHEEEGRAFLKSMLQSPADLIPDEDAGTLTVRFHSLANPRSNLALRALCDTCTLQNARYPGTRLRLVFEGA